MSPILKMQNLNGELVAKREISMPLKKILKHFREVSSQFNETKPVELCFEELLKSPKKIQKATVPASLTWSRQQGKVLVIFAGAAGDEHWELEIARQVEAYSLAAEGYLYVYRDDDYTDELARAITAAVIHFPLNRRLAKAGFEMDSYFLELADSLGRKIPLSLLSGTQLRILALSYIEVYHHLPFGMCRDLENLVKKNNVQLWSAVNQVKPEFDRMKNFLIPKRCNSVLDKIIKKWRLGKNYHKYDPWHQVPLVLSPEPGR